MQPILLVEDDDSSAKLTRRTIQRGAILNPVMHCPSATSALLHIETLEVPLLVLLDLGLPDMHGLEVLQYLRNHKRTDISSLCVFILTVHDDQEMLTRTMAHGANAFLSKNLNLSRFLMEVQNCGLVLDMGTNE